MKNFRNSQNTPVKATEYKIFGAGNINYIVLNTDKCGIMLRTLDKEEYVSRYPGRIYRLDSDDELNIPLLVLDENGDYEELLAKAEKYREATLRASKRREQEKEKKKRFTGLFRKVFRF